MTEIERTERVVEVADIEPRFRHGIIAQLFKHLEPGDSLQIIVDHDRSGYGSTSTSHSERNANGRTWNRARTSGVSACGIARPTTTQH
jgi:uncharacterized protein (DUF2249 family)